ncbi:Triosephosphate isomerase [Parathielavia hyrcaniae]|uniref:Triosephosphate isomerase n=1 Tax=Parathielavia hyrcaniae TaxID=113614 RepID=A0AAN6Q820_9PEZI|nr:Triosephosphate isomerase [Parathielavia hyrcaniae]
MSAPPPTPIKPTSGNRPFIAVSTKIYFSYARTTSFTASVLSLLTSNLPSLNIDVLLIPDFVSLVPTIATIAAAAAPNPIINKILAVGAQNCAAHGSGPFTGEVSAAVLSEIGCAVVEVGHAERRRLFGEADDAVVRDKVAAVVRNGMVPLVCVGEETAMMECGRVEGERGVVAVAGVEGAAREVVRQVEAALESVDGEKEVVLAYEPVWAIGAAEPAGAEYVMGVVKRVRESEVVRSRKGTTRIVYGGAAGPGLWERLGGEVDGLFLGRFGHDPDQFVRMIYEVAGVSMER